MANVENIRKWVEALRSGKYEQARGSLARVHGERVTYCCLGVASDVSGICRVEGTPKRNGWGRLRFNGEADLLPETVVAWLGVTDESPSASKRSLAAANDAGLTFAEIADLIEAEWLA